MKDPFLSIKLEHAREEHRKLRKAIIEHDNVYLLLQYGCLKNADERLLELEYFLNYKEEKAK